MRKNDKWLFTFFNGETGIVRSLDNVTIVKLCKQDGWAWNFIDKATISRQLLLLHNLKKLFGDRICR